MERFVLILVSTERHEEGGYRTDVEQTWLKLRSRS